MLVLLHNGKPVLGVVVEAQLSIDERKRFAWPVYVVGLRARRRCPVCLLVVTASEPVARWASVPIELGGNNQFCALVLGPAGVPQIEDLQRAKADPELAVLSAMAHGRGPDPQKSLQIALAALGASVGLDADRSVLYLDLILYSLSEAVRRSLQAMDPAKYEFQSEFAKRFLSLGKAEGKAEGKVEGRAEGKAEGEVHGRAEIVLKLLALKFGKLSAKAKKTVQSASIAELDLWAERVLSAKTLAQVWKPAKKR